ncbi:MAG: 4'-phosphopantetheinyl transferase superfamily protein [Flavobacteriaceae bacterium]|nr:4'-phosphopantetheinyl transferase superfamily protein [Flavobacteriaceae bacterium]
MHIYCIHIDIALDKIKYNDFIPYISPEKRAKINRYKNEIDKIRSLFGDLIIRYILCKYYGFHNNEVNYEYEELGKPYLKNHKNLHFNISHSGEWVVGIVSRNTVGIDIEKVTDIKQNLTSFVFSNEENYTFSHLIEMEKNEFFFKLWTLKESYVKAKGSGLSEGLNTLNIYKENDEIRLKKEGKLVKAYFETLDCIEGYKFSFCSVRKFNNFDIKLYAIDEFYQEVKKLLN